jgi:hypothetical protein
MSDEIVIFRWSDLTERCGKMTHSDHKFIRKATEDEIALHKRIGSFTTTDHFFPGDKVICVDSITTTTHSLKLNEIYTVKTYDTKSDSLKLEEEPTRSYGTYRFKKLPTSLEEPDDDLVYNFKSGDVVECIDATDMNWLTKGKKYVVDSVVNYDQNVYIKADNGSKICYNVSHFKLTEPEFKKYDYVVCTDIENKKGYLTLNKIYKVCDIYKDANDGTPLIKITNDSGTDCGYLISRFKKLELKPEDVIKRIFPGANLTVNKDYIVKKTGGNYVKIENDKGLTTAYDLDRFAVVDEIKTQSTSKRIDVFEAGDLVQYCHYDKYADSGLTLNENYVISRVLFDNRCVYLNGNTLPYPSKLFKYIGTAKTNALPKLVPQTSKLISSIEVNSNSNNLKTKQYDDKSRETTGKSIKVNRLVPRISTDPRTRGNVIRGEISKNSIRLGHLSNREISRFS